MKGDTHMNPLASFEIPNAEVLNLIARGKKFQAIKAWRSQDHKLSNGIRVCPRLKVCVDMLKVVELGLESFPIAISLGGYTVRDN